MGAIITSATVIWQTNHGAAEVKKHLMDKLQTVNEKLDILHRDLREDRALILTNGQHVMTALDRGLV